MRNLTLIILLLAIAQSLPTEDAVTAPGMLNQAFYSGYLKTTLETRKIHYVFVKARANSETAPVTVWFNGGPGCSSLIGLLQQIGPYIVGNDYKLGDQLTRNQYSWNEKSNLLFLESPAIVGFSTDKNSSFLYTDDQTADDAFAALKDFLFTKAPQFKANSLYLSGQSYAGKYIPDVAYRIIQQNRLPENPYIHIVGLLIGNGVMDFTDNSLDKSQIQYMYEHDFVEERLWSIYKTSCLKNFYSPRCQYFRYELDKDEDNLNPYNVYELCKDVSSAQTARLVETIKKLNKKQRNAVFTKLQANQQLQINEQSVLSLSLDAINECPNDNGAIKYWNLNKIAFHVNQTGKEWAPCTDLNYTISESGSMPQYRAILLNSLKIWLFSGDWDDVVPYRDTEKNLGRLLNKVGAWDSWFVGEHHAGFYQLYEKNITLITFKGGSHMVPQVKPKQAYQMFYNFIRNMPINTPV